jgi:serine/threonine protein kinase/HAMP domain-containing protein
MNKETQSVGAESEPESPILLADEDRTLTAPLSASSHYSSECNKTLLDPNFNLQHTTHAGLGAHPSSLEDEDKAVLDQNVNNKISVGKSAALPAQSADGTAATGVSQRATPTPIAGGTLALPLGFKLHEYRIDSILGQGGFGITYLATDVHLNAKVAIKEYLPEDFAARASDKSVSPRRAEDREFYQHALDCFLIEARTLATFRHPNIVRVARFFEANDTAYMVLEYERGKSLKSWWRTHADISEQELLALLLPLLDGLSVVHETGYLHRDIKPDNIYVRQDDGSLVLLDFGAARQTVVGATDGMSSVVTPGYGPIEQHENGNQGPWTDIYALGATLYTMISGKKPPPSPERMVSNDPMPPAETLGKGRFSPEFLRAIDWALKPLVEDRPQNVAAFCQALYAAHASTLNLQAALLKAGDDSEEGDGRLTRVQSPRSLKGRLIRFGRNMLHPGSWPMAVKMTLAMVLTALMPMLITAYYNLSGSLSAVSTSEMRNLEQLAQSTAGRVSQLINDSRNLATYLGTDEDFVSFLEAPTANGKRALRAKLDGLVKANPDVHLLMIMDTAGTAVVSSDPAVTGRNFKFREYFKVAMEGRPHTTGVVVGAVAGAAGVFYSHPVVDASNKVIGVVVLRIKASSITSILDEMRQGSQRTPFMIDGDGIVIHHPDPTLLYSSLAPLPKETMDQIIADQRFRRDHIDTLNMPDLARAMVGTQEQGNISHTSTLSNTEEIVGFAPVRGHNWVIGVTESRAFFAEPLNRLFSNVLYSVIVVGVVFLMLALLFARTIVKPIRELNAAAHALKSGDYDRAGIKVTSNDEIGQLARTFNVMIDVLRQRERERERMNRRAIATDSLRKGSQ